MKVWLVGLLTVYSWLGQCPRLKSLPAQFLITEREAARCPAEVEPLTNLLLNDLPGYANRVSVRSGELAEQAGIYTYVILAGKSEFEPLSLGAGQYQSPVTDPEPPQQVFFTTLERQYNKEEIIVTQNYHWLFLTQTEEGWRLVALLTRFGYPSPNAPPLPPEETSRGIIGQAIQLWLRDCRAGVIRTQS